MAKTYNPKDVKVTINGVPVTGFTDATDAIQVAREADSVDKKIGITGEGAFVEMNDKSAIVTIKLLATSLMNDVLSALENGNVEFAASIEDVRGTTIGLGASCRVQKPADIAFGNEIGDREWSLVSLEWIGNVGGNSG